MPIDRRGVISLIASAIVTPGFAKTALAAEQNVDAVETERESPLIREDYAAARRLFDTDLLVRGPAPDKAQPLTPPEGARALPYRSGSLDLVAWISTNIDPRAPKPGVVVLHGGNALWPGHWDLARPYVAAGYAALMPAVRGENGLPGAFSGFYDETADVIAAAEALRAQPGVDPGRLFIAGHSIGGTLTLLAAQAGPMFRAAASYSSAPDARAFFRHYPEDVRFDTADPREFDMRSALCFAQSFKCPVLLLRGSEEHHSDAAIRLTVERARAKGLSAHRETLEGNHFSAIPGETATSLEFFESV